MSSEQHLNKSLKYSYYGNKYSLFIGGLDPLTSEVEIVREIESIGVTDIIDVKIQTHGILLSKRYAEVHLFSTLSVEIIKNKYPNCENVISFTAANKNFLDEVFYKQLFLTANFKRRALTKSLSLDVISRLEEFNLVPEKKFALRVVGSKSKLQLSKLIKNSNTEFNNILEIYLASCYSMLFNYDGVFNQKFEDRIKDYLLSSVLEKITVVKFDRFILVLEKQWNYFKNLMSKINNTYLYCNDSCKDFNINLVTNICLRNFRDLIVCNYKVERQLRSSLLKLVTEQRVNNLMEVSSLKLVKDTCEMLTELSSKGENNVYESIFEKDFLSNQLIFTRNLQAKR